MKMTLVLPDAVHRRAKSRASLQGISLSQFVTEALGRKLGEPSHAGQKPSMKQIGKLKRS